MKQKYRYNRAGTSVIEELTVGEVHHYWNKDIGCGEL